MPELCIVLVHNIYIHIITQIYTILKMHFFVKTFKYGNFNATVLHTFTHACMPSNLYTYLHSWKVEARDFSSYYFYQNWKSQPLANTGSWKKNEITPFSSSSSSCFYFNSSTNSSQQTEWDSKIWTGILDESRGNKGIRFWDSYYNYLLLQHINSYNACRMVCRRSI